LYFYNHILPFEYSILKRLVPNTEIMRILSTFLFLIIASISFGQSISQLQSELRKTKDKDRIMNIKYDLAELLKTKNKFQAAKYAFDSYNLARELKDDEMAALAAFLDGEIQLSKNDSKKAIARFKASLRHSNATGDDEFAIENLKQLENIERSRDNDKLADNYSQQIAELQGIEEVKQIPTPQSTNSIPQSSTASSSSSTSSSKSSRIQIDDNQTRDYVNIIRKLKVEKADLEDENNNLLNKLERIGNNEMSDKELQELKKELETQRNNKDQDREATIAQLSEKERQLAMAADKLRKAHISNEKREKEFASLSEEAKKDKMLVQEAQNEALQNRNFLYLLGLISSIMLLFASIFYNRFRVNKKAKTALEETNRQIEEERKLSDELLLNILPSPIAKELKESGKASAEKFDNVTVLFTDFKNFTKISERLTPEQLVRELDYCFRGFDFILSQYNVEKIKTIGDAYMCASGLTKSKTLPINIIKAALEMQEFLEDYKKERMVKGLPFFEARMGIHTGPVVAGVVGVKKFAYDIWGDTVNIAARMEANCEVGKVNISESTYNQVRYNFNCEHRGKIDAKNKGFIDMYYVKQPVAKTVGV